VEQGLHIAAVLPQVPLDQREAARVGALRVEDPEAPGGVVVVRVVLEERDPQVHGLVRVSAVLVAHGQPADGVCIARGLRVG